MRFSLYQSIVLIILIIGNSSCNKPETNEQIIIDRLIEKHGGDKYRQSTIAFDFRGKKYLREFEGENEIYKSIHKDTLDRLIENYLISDSFRQTVDQQTIPLSEQKQQAKAASLNSVFYFALLPYKLNDPSVNKNYLGDFVIGNQTYHKIQITFDKNGGGGDYDDVFIYWVNIKNLTLDYLAYSYSEENGRGYRFREFYNRREVEGILFQDYHNYKPKKTTNIEVTKLDQLFVENQLTLVSEIQLKNIEVK